MPAEVPSEDTGDADRLRILELLEQQKITAAEAAELLAALGDRGRDVRRRERYKWLAEDLAPALPAAFAAARSSVFSLNITVTGPAVSQTCGNIQPRHSNP